MFCLHGEIFLWDVTTGQPLSPPLIGHASLVTDVAFSPDGKTLASGSGMSPFLEGEGSTLILWDANTESWRARACSIANRNLTMEEWQQYVGDEPYRPTCPNLPVPEE